MLVICRVAALLKKELYKHSVYETVYAKKKVWPSYDQIKLEEIALNWLNVDL